MIDALLRIVDKLKELLELREKRAEKMFEKFIEPVYKDMETVHKDYLETLHQLADILPAAGTADPEVIRQACEKALEFVHPRSRQLEVLRDTVRSYASLRDQFHGDVELFMNAVEDYFDMPRRFRAYPSRYLYWLHLLSVLSTDPEEFRGMPTELRPMALGMIGDLKDHWEHLSKVFVEIKLKVVSQ